MQLRFQQKFAPLTSAKFTLPGAQAIKDQALDSSLTSQCNDIESASCTGYCTCLLYIVHQFQYITRAPRFYNYKYC